MDLQPIYLPTNCNAAYQLNWSLSVFGKHQLRMKDELFIELSEAIAKDDLKILDYRSVDRNVVQFFVSSRTKHSPSQIIGLIKGRWQYIAQKSEPIYLRRNYRICSVGSARRIVLDDYVAKQTTKHIMADCDVQTMFDSLQYHDPDCDLCAIQRSGHGEFNHSLQLVFETAFGWHETRRETLIDYQRMIASTCKKYGWSLSRIGLLSNHMHVLLAADVSEAPESIALCLLNNLAYTQGMKPIFKFSYYVGTLGNYDRGAIWNSLARDRVSDKRVLYQRS